MLSAAQEDRRRAGSGGLAAGGRRVGVTRLVLTDFRNYRSARLDLDPAPVVLTGPNGAGKTNLLEALSFLSPGRGLRNARLGEIDRRPSPPTPLPEGEGGGPLSGISPLPVGEGPGMRGWAVAATAETGGGPIRIGTGRDPAAGERRLIRIDGEPAKSQAALAERLAVLWLTPAMDRLFAERPSGRRRLMDRLVFALDPAHAGRVARYEDALHERSRLLRPEARGRRDDPAWLGALEGIMAAEGLAVAAARRDWVDRLDRACADAAGAFPRARLRVAGAVEEWLDSMPALAAEERLRAALAESRTQDALTGGAAIGPHRSDLAVMHAEKGIAAEAASTGEQKALLIAILLAEAELQRSLRGEPPLLLLDEVAAHLDAPRRAALFERLAGLAGQSWLSGTDAALFVPLRGTARFLSVADGNLSPAEP
jgi:DNA replication and repair protein RecF